MTNSPAVPIALISPLPPLQRQARRDMFAQAVPADQVRFVEIDDLIARADAHVTIAEDGMARIGQTISEVLSPLELEHVRHLISLHNARPVGLRASSAERDPMLKSQSQGQIQAMGERCVEDATASTYWWGFRIYMNHCLCNDIEFVVGAGAAAASAIFTILTAAEVVTAIGAGWIGLAVGIIVTMALWITWADGYCGGMGCNYNQSWTVQGWITTVC